MKIRSLFQAASRRCRLSLFAVACGRGNPVPANGALMPPSQFLPEKPGFTSWRTLGQVELVKKDRKMVPAFAQGGDGA